MTLSGLVDAGYQSNDYKGAKVSGIANNGSATSTIQFAGTEDLGGGLTANFKLNSDFNPTSTNGNAGYGGVMYTSSATGVAGSSGSWLNSEQKVGLSGNFGSIDMGVINNLTLVTAGTGQPFGTAIGSGFRALYNTDVIGTLGSAGTAGSAVRWDHTVQYKTPSFSGVSAALSQVKGNTSASSDAFSTTFGNYDRPGISEAQINYNNGPINASYATQKQTGKDVTQLNASTGVLVDSKLNTLAANYTYGPATLYVLNQSTKADSASATTRDNKYTAFSVKYVMGATSLIASTGKFTNNLTTSGANSSKLLGVGADYELSKRTSLYARYESLKDDNGYVANPTKLAAVTGNNDRTRTAIGLRHAF